MPLHNERSDGVTWNSSERTVHYDLHQILHVVSEKCLEMSRDGAKLLINTCDSSNAYQQWVFQEYSAEKARQYGML
ncbi:Polypeptide N-acetylgalactosaminyltransferase 5 [Toxocara canis]|uniref:Polypeptide N-acetylgalactosaminyltransferase 5 n=1 Tax=Toxocara canis TaxID=6265 RepID=A0A0B2V4T2_TOXCA|nr:Polypeptide N-acetylgalactosaminyltransferase 5 [Toxocara canis]